MVVSWPGAFDEAPGSTNRIRRKDHHALRSRKLHQIRRARELGAPSDGKRPSSRFWDRIAEGYAKKPVADEAAYQEKLRITREYLRPDMVVFEFGCGTGSTALLHAPHVRQIHATDISSEMIAIARRKAEGNRVENVLFEQTSIDELDPPDASYDAVLGLSILHLLRDRNDAIAKVWKMLKPGGIFVSTTPCLGGVAKYVPLRAIVPIGRLFGRLPLVKFVSKDDLLASLSGAGFAIDHRWDPDNGTTLFVVAKKPA